MSGLLDCVEIEPAEPARFSVLWLHGLGADGHDFEPIVPGLRIKEPVRFVFPHGPVRPVTLNGGMAMRAWYDIYSLERGGREDDAGVRDSERLVSALIKRENERGIPNERLVLAGFSQGGAIALHTMIRLKQKLAGVLALSTYVPIRQTAVGEDTKVNHDTPIYMAHGSQDPVVPCGWGKQSADFLTELGYAPKWHEYPMPHCVIPQQINDIGNWLNQLFAGIK